MDPRRAREVLRKQGIFIHENDPVLDVAALCDAAMSDTLVAIEGVVKAAADRTSAAAAQTLEAARESAEVVVSQGAAFLVEQFREIARDTTATMLAELRRETATAARASRLATRIAWGLASLVAVVVAGVGGFLLAVLGHG